MKLDVKVKFGSKVQCKIEEGKAEVTLTAQPEKGKANKQLLEVLAKELGVPKSRISIVSGAKSRRKVVKY